MSYSYEKNLGGRPKIEIDWEQFDKLCELQCTQEEIASYFDCSADTISRRVNEEFGVSFAELFEQKRGKGKIALRRRQFQATESGNASLLIWLGKQWLGQKDQHELSTDKPIKLQYSLDDNDKDGAESDNHES